MDVKLIRILDAAKKQVEIFRNADGSEILLSPYGGRVLGLYPEGEDQNFYWTNPALAAVGTARSFLNSEKWQNTGGERTWLGPEVDFFFPRFPDLSFYHQPRPLDSGRFKILRKPGMIGMNLDFKATSYRYRKELGLRITKWVGPAANPLRANRGFTMESTVRYAGYSMTSILELTRAARVPVPVGLWSLTQMPHGGEMIIPTYGKAQPTVFFGKIPRGHLKIAPSVIRYRMEAAGEHKIGLRAHVTTGRMGYFLTAGTNADLVIRNYSGNPSGDYVDGPATDLTDSGYGAQACNVSNHDLGNFGELEYHVPAIGLSGNRRMMDIAQVWAFRGPRRDVARVAQELLGVPARNL